MPAGKLTGSFLKKRTIKRQGRRRNVEWTIGIREKGKGKEKRVKSKESFRPGSLCTPSEYKENY
jgi:hypothetical protein